MIGTEAFGGHAGSSPPSTFAFGKAKPLLYKQPSSLRASSKLHDFRIPTYMSEQTHHPHLLALGWSLE
jgi:hypothetical protein